MHATFGVLLSGLGRFDEAVGQARAGADLDPVSPFVRHNAGTALSNAGKLDEALAQFQGAIDLEPNHAPVLVLRARVFSNLGRHDEAIESAQRAVTMTTRNPLSVARALAAAGQRQQAETLREEMRQRSRQEFVSPRVFADIAAAMGEADEAMEWLERAVEARVPSLVALGVVPTWDFLRADPRFQALLKRIGLPNLHTA